jgi:hypothetical protein
MSTVANKSAKTANVNAKIVNVNLDAFTKKLESVTVKEKITKDAFYIYPENFTIKMIGEKEGKQFRNKMRTKIKFYENNIFVAAKQQDNEKLISVVKEFNAFYKANYKINDYSLKSISQSTDELKTADLSTMLGIIKTVNAAISPDATTNTEKKITTKKQPRNVKK